MGIEFSQVERVHVMIAVGVRLRVDAQGWRRIGVIPQLEIPQAQTILRTVKAQLAQSAGEAGLRRVAADRLAHGQVLVRRPGLPIEWAWKFYPRFWVESVVKIWKLTTLYSRLRRTYKLIKADKKRFKYMDVALTPVSDHDVEDLELFHTPSAPAFVAQEQRRQHAHEHAAIA